MAKENINNSKRVRNDGVEIATQKEGSEKYLTWDELLIQAQKSFAHPLILLLTVDQRESFAQFYKATKTNWHEGIGEAAWGKYSEFLVYVFDGDLFTVSTKKR